MVSLHIFKHQANTILLQKCHKSAVFCGIQVFLLKNMLNFRTKRREFNKDESLGQITEDLAGTRKDSLRQNDKLKAGI
jgi:hypothetical protein